MNWKFLIFCLVGALFLTCPTLAQDYSHDDCENPCHGLNSGEIGMCRVYCWHMECDLINDGDPLSAAQASQNACANVAVGLVSRILQVHRSEVDPDEAMDILNNDHHIPCAPPCDCGGGV